MAKTGLEICKEAHDTLWCVEGLSYDNACKLIKDLNKIDGIVANITVGGVKISCGRFVGDMKAICALYKTTPCKGLTMKVQDTLLRKK